MWFLVVVCICCDLLVVDRGSLFKVVIWVFGKYLSVNVGWMYGGFWYNELLFDVVIFFFY